MNSGDYIVYMPVDPLLKDPYLVPGESYFLLSMFPDNTGHIVILIPGKGLMEYLRPPGKGLMEYFVDSIHFLSQEEYRIHKINEIIKD